MDISGTNADLGITQCTVQDHRVASLHVANLFDKDLPPTRRPVNTLPAGYTDNFLFDTLGCGHTPGSGFAAPARL